LLLEIRGWRSGEQGGVAYLRVCSGVCSGVSAHTVDSWRWAEIGD